MCDVDQDNIYNLYHILLFFEAILGIRLNLSQSELGLNLSQSELVAVGRYHIRESW